MWVKKTQLKFTIAVERTTVYYSVRVGELYTIWFFIRLIRLNIFRKNHYKTGYSQLLPVLVVLFLKYRKITCIHNRVAGGPAWKYIYVCHKVILWINLVSFIWNERKQSRIMYVVVMLLMSHRLINVARVGKTKVTLCVSNNQLV